MLSGYDSRQTGGGRHSQSPSYQQGPPSYGKPQPAPPRQPQQGGYGGGPSGYGGGEGGYGGGTGRGRGYDGGPDRRYNQGIVSPPPHDHRARPAQGSDPSLLPLFKAVDKAGT